MALTKFEKGRKPLYWFKLVNVNEFGLIKRLPSLFKFSQGLFNLRLIADGADVRALAGRQVCGLPPPDRYSDLVRA